MFPNSLTFVVEFIHDTDTLNLYAPLSLIYSFLILSSIAKSSFENIALLVDSCHFHHLADEYVLPETSADYMNVPSYQIPTSPQSYDSGVCCSPETNTVDECKWVAVLSY